MDACLTISEIRSSLPQGMFPRLWIGFSEEKRLPSQLNKETTKPR